MGVNKNVISNLRKAVRGGDLKNVKRMIESEDLYWCLKSSEGYELLCHALKRKDDDMARLLLRYRAKVTMGKHFKGRDAPLHYAVRNENIEFVAILLRSNAFVDAEGQNGETPLHVAAKRKNVKLTKLLLDYNASINCKNINDETPLHFAAANGCTEIVNYILMGNLWGNPVCFSSNENLTPLHLAARNGHDEIVRLLLPHVDCNAVTKDGKTALYLAVENGHFLVVEELISRADSNNLSNALALHFANMKCFKNNVYREEIVKILKTKFSAEFKIKHQDFLGYSVENSYIEFVEKLLKFKFDSITSKERGAELLSSAIKTKQIKIIEILIKYGCEVNAVDENNQTLISKVVESQNLEIFKLFVSEGADIRDNTLLHIAIKRKFIEMVEILLERNANVNFTDLNGSTPLHLNASLQFENGAYWSSENMQERAIVLGMATLLIKHGANIDARQKDGKTPLHVAAENGSEQLLNLLLEHHANPDSLCKEGFTPLHYAVSKSNKNCVATLIDYGADIFAKGKDCIEIYDLSMQVFQNCPIHFTWSNAKCVLHIIDDHREKLNIIEIVKNQEYDDIEVNSGIISMLEELNFRKKCFEELRRMQKISVANSLVSLFDILAKPKERLKQDIILAVEAMDLRRDFPKYGRIIENQVKKRRDRVTLMEKCREFFSPLWSLPYLCINKIFKLMSVPELRNIANVSNDDSTREAASQIIHDNNIDAMSADMNHHIGVETSNAIISEMNNDPNTDS